MVAMLTKVFAFFEIDLKCLHSCQHMVFVCITCSELLMRDNGTSMQGVMRPSVKYRNKRYGITMRRVKVYEVETLGNPIQGRAAACPRRYDLFRFKIIQSHFHLRRSTCIRIDCVSNFQFSIGICIEVIIRIEPRHAYYFKTCIIVTCGQVVVVFRNRRTSRVSVQVVIINGWRRIY